MNFLCQKEPLIELDTLRLSDRHSILIEGPSGCGKTYLAMQYAKMLKIEDFQIVSPKVDDIKSSIDTCLSLSTPIVLCIENLDTGVPAASYALLKFLEEPLPNVYIIVTCRNLQQVPDTIVSRSAVVVTGPPVDVDLSTYALSVNKNKFDELHFTPIWSCVRTFKDVDTVLNLNPEQVTYFHELPAMCKFNDSVSNIVWKLGHYSDNTECPVELVVRCIMNIVGTEHAKRAGISCLNDLATRRIASHAVLAKFAFELKYCE